MDRNTLAALSRDDLIDLIVLQAQQISLLTARIAELEARLGAPGKTPDNSSLPPSKGQKPNLPGPAGKKLRMGRPGVARALAEQPDKVIQATLAACPHCSQKLAAAIRPRLKPTTISTCHRSVRSQRASTAIAASAPAAASGLQRRRRTACHPARRSGPNCAR